MSELDRLTKMEIALRRIIVLADPENQSCLPSCDSIAHDELCSWANTDQVMAKLAREALEP